MKKLSFGIIGLVVFGVSCQKEPLMHNLSPAETPGATTSKTTFTTYKIRAGQHYCDQNTLKSISTSQMNFVARFNTSAIYTTVQGANQYDINKLWGFSEGFNHQYNSARVGWGYSNNALRLFGYVYAKGVRYSAEICTIPFDSDISCSIKLSGAYYQITANTITVTLPRGSTTTKASGYQLYPYFGGDETAPHDITIGIK